MTIRTLDDGTRYTGSPFSRHSAENTVSRAKCAGRRLRPDASAGSRNAMVLRPYKRIVEVSVTTKTKLQQAFERLLRLRSDVSWVAPLLARLTLGVLFASTGWGKVHNLQKVTEFFVQLGIPLPRLQATLVAYVEVVGGCMLLLGIATELAAIPLIVSMAVAIVTAKRDELHSLPELFGLVEWTYLVLLFWIVFVGAGRMSLDAWIHRRFKAPVEVTRVGALDESRSH